MRRHSVASRVAFYRRLSERLLRDHPVADHLRKKRDDCGFIHQRMIARFRSRRQHARFDSENGVIGALLVTIAKEPHRSHAEKRRRARNREPLVVQ